VNALVLDTTFCHAPCRACANADFQFASFVTSPTRTRVFLIASIIRHQFHRFGRQVPTPIREHVQIHTMGTYSRDRRRLFYSGLSLYPRTAMQERIPPMGRCHRLWTVLAAVAHGDWWNGCWVERGQRWRWIHRSPHSAFSPCSWENCTLISMARTEPN